MKRQIHFILLTILLLMGMVSTTEGQTDQSTLFIDTFDDDSLDPIWTKTEGKRSVRPDISFSEDLVEQNGRLEFVKNGTSIGGNVFGIQVVKEIDDPGTIQIQFDYNVSNRGFWYIYGDDNSETNGYYVWLVSFVDVSDLTPGDLRVEYRNTTIPATSSITAIRSARDVPASGKMLITLEFDYNNSLAVTISGDYNLQARAIDLPSWSMLGIGVDIDHEVWNASDFVYIDNYVEVRREPVVTVTTTVSQTKFPSIIVSSTGIALLVYLRFHMYTQKERKNC